MRHKKNKSIQDKQAAILSGRTPSPGYYIHAYMLKGGAMIVRGSDPICVTNGDPIPAGSRLRLTQDCIKMRKANPGMDISTGLYDFTKTADDSPILSADMRTIRDRMIPEAEYKKRVIRSRALQVAAETLAPGLRSTTSVWRPTTITANGAVPPPVQPTADTSGQRYAGRDREDTFCWALHEVRGILSRNVEGQGCAECRRASAFITNVLLNTRTSKAGSNV